MRRIGRALGWIAVALSAVVAAHGGMLGLVGLGVCPSLVRNAWAGGGLLEGGYGLVMAMALAASWVFLPVSLCGAVVVALVCRRGAARQPARVLLVLNLLPLATMLIGTTVMRCANQAAIARLERAADQVIGAIGRYEQEHGAPPQDLASLVPRYLPAVPTTGLADCPQFIYRPATRRWEFEQANSSLELLVSPQGQVVEATAGRERRAGLVGLSLAQARAKLGGEGRDLGRLFDGRWRLTVKASGWNGAWLTYRPGVRPANPWRERWNQTSTEYEPLEAGLVERADRE